MPLWSFLNYVGAHRPEIALGVVFVLLSFDKRLFCCIHVWYAVLYGGLGLSSLPPAVNYGGGLMHEYEALSDTNY